MVDFKEEKEALASKQTELLTKLADAEKLLLPFERISNELYDLVINCDDDKIEMVSLVWFKAFLAYKDECMVLSKGELIRKYHIKQHKIHIHDREEERRYYNSKYSLSSLSRDGIDYEYRQLLNKYPNKSMNNIATKSDEIGNRVDSLSKALDDSFRRLEEALKKRQIKVDMILFHNGEQIRAKEEGIPLFNLLRGDMNTEKATREQSLTTTLDEDLIRNCQSKSTNNLQGNKKRQNVIYDSDEDKKQEEDEKKRLRRIEKEKRKEETNFQMDVSLDQLKSNRPADYENTMIVDESNTRHVNDTNDKIAIDPKLLIPLLYKALYPLSNQGDASVQSCNNDMEVLDNNDTTDAQASAAPKSRVSARKNPFFEKTVSLDHVLLMRLYVSEQKYGFSYTDIGVCINWNVCVESGIPPARAELFVSCDDIFHYLFKYLLTDEKLKEKNIIEYPSYIVINDDKYSIGDKFNVPKDQKIVMHVHCYENDLASLCLTEIITMLRQISNDDTESSSNNDIQFAQYLNSSFQLIEKVLMVINSSTDTMNFSFDSMASGLTGVSSKCLRTLYDTIKRKDSTVVINVSTVSTKIDSITLASLLYHCTSVNIQCCGIKADHLKDVTRFFTNNNMSIDTGGFDTGGFQSLKLLNISFNNFLKTKTKASTRLTPSTAALNDNVTKTPWSEFISMVFTKCINLEELNLSNCADNDVQMNMLCEGLSLALKLRSELGLSPIFRITINGVSSYPDHAVSLDNLVNSNFVSNIVMSGIDKTKLFKFI